MEVIVTPTGKAVYNIKGNTIHSALATQASQSLKEYKPLDSGRLNTQVSAGRCRTDIYR